jgi:hypothetical protein
MLLAATLSHVIVYSTAAQDGFEGHRSAMSFLEMYSR